MFLYWNYDEQNYKVNWTVYQLLHGLQLKNVKHNNLRTSKQTEIWYISMLSVLLLIKKAIDYLRQTGSFLADLGVPKTSQVRKYFLYYVTKNVSGP